MNSKFFDVVLKSTTFADKIIIVIAIILSLVTFFISCSANLTGNSVVIECDGNIHGVYDISDNNEICVKSNFGTNTVCIKNKAVSVVETSCPDKYEIAKTISKSGQAIICLPNRLVVKIQGHKNSVDGVTY